MTHHAWVEDTRTEEEILRDVNAELGSDTDPMAPAIGVSNGLALSLLLWAMLAAAAWCL